MNAIEKLFVTAAAALVGHEIGKTKGETEEERKQNAAKNALLFGGAGLLGCELFAENDDTVNYSLHHRGKKVYDGIALEERLDRRISEHKYSGKIFDKVVFDDAKARSIALDLEERMIRRNRCKYNKHHNC